MLGSKEHYDIIEAFERTTYGCRLDKEPKDLWPRRHVYQNGETNNLFLAFLDGCAFGKAYYREADHA